MGFNWLYFRLGKKLELDREQARTLFELAQLVRCMPGAIASAGPCNSAMQHLLAKAVGDQREILVFDESTAPAQGPQPVLRTNLPGLPLETDPVYGIRKLQDFHTVKLRPGLRYCLVHLVESDPRRLMQALQHFCEQLMPHSMMLVHIPEGATGLAIRSVLEGWAATREEKLLTLPSGYALMLHLPQAKPAVSRSRMQVPRAGSIPVSQ